MAGTIVVDRLESDASYASRINVVSNTVFSSPVNFTGGMQVGGQDASFGGMRNRIINGDMRINQRGNTTYTVPSGSNLYTLDRWEAVDAHANAALTVTQSSDAPAGFSNSAIVTVTASGTTGAGDVAIFRQAIEGFNVDDLDFGTASARTISVSFWVKGSVTGTYAVAVSNSGNNRHYIRHYTINSANTWEYKSITIPGDTTGTWFKDNSAGLRLKFTLAAGTTYRGTVDTWNAADVIGTSSSVNLTSTNGATWQITGVQLEKGSTASAFEQLNYGLELAMCQRYYHIASLFNFATNAYYQGYFGGSTAVWNIRHPVQMRSVPTATISQPTQVQYYSQSGVWTNTTITLQTYNDYGTHSSQGKTDVLVGVSSDSQGGGKLLYLVGGATTGLPTIALSSEF
jgi:hypothetical protein